MPHLYVDVVEWFAVVLLLLRLATVVVANAVLCNAVIFNKKLGHSRPLFVFIFCLFKQAKQTFQPINVKNVHPVYSAGI